MAIDTKPNFSSNKFEQCTFDIMNLSGCTQVFGTFDVQPSGSIDSCSGYQVSGITIFDTGVQSNALQIGQNASSAACSIVIGANACSTQVGNIAIGYNVTATGTSVVNIGGFSVGAGNTVVGKSAIACTSSVAIGSGKAYGNNSVSVGLGTCACLGYSVALGSNAYACGSDSIALGHIAQAVTSNGIALGCTANACCSNSIAIGAGSISYGICGIAIGYRTCANYYSTAVGILAKATGATSIAIGYNALAYAACGIAMGNNASADGANGIAIGNTAKANGGVNNIAIGCGVLQNNVCGKCNIAIGNVAMLSNTGGTDNVVIGAQALRLNTKGNQNIAIGYTALYNNISGCDNIAQGYAALRSNTTGLWNIALGLNSLYDNTIGNLNIGIGRLTLNQSVSGSSNIAMGNASQYNRTSGNGNISIGESTLEANVNGFYNTAIGYAAGRFTGTGSTCNVFVGYNAGYSETGSSRLHISTCSSCPLIYGEFDNKLVCVKNKLSACQLQMTCGAVDGYVLTSDASGNASWATSGDGGAASGERISKTITQASHGFAVKDVVGFSGTTYNKAIADGTYDGEVLGIVTASADTNTFVLTQAGYVTGLTSLVANTTYFLSDATAGLLTTTEPTTEGHISKSVLIADSTTTGWVLPYVGYIVTTGSSGGGSWGTITGTLSDQTDLQTALDAKADDTYTLNSPATCTVGGVSPGYVLTGKSLACIIQDAFAPYVPPTFSAFAVNISSVVEVGSLLAGTKSFSWTATAGGNVCAGSVGICEVGGSLLGSGFNYNSSPQSLNIGVLTNNSPTTWTWRISGCSTQSSTFTRDVSKSSIYPYMWGVVTSGSCPTITSTLINSTGTKVIASVGTTVSVNFASSNQWTWFAMPCACAARTKWFVAVGNCGFIDRACASDKYPNSCSLPVTDTVNGCWSSVCYTVYMSGFAATDNEAIAFRTY